MLIFATTSRFINFVDGLLAAQIAFQIVHRDAAVFQLAVIIQSSV